MFNGLKKCDLIELIVKVDPSYNEVRGKLCYKSKMQLKLMLANKIANKKNRVEIELKLIKEREAK